MSKKYFLSVCFIVVSFFACNIDCQKNPDFEYKFYNSIKILEDLQNGKEYTTTEKFNALRFLQAVSGIDAQIVDFSGVLYSDYQSFCEDKHKWENWYNLNKCSMSNDVVDSLFLIYKNYRLRNF